MKTILQIDHLSKTYSGGKKAVDDLSLRVCEGDIYGFIGQNGAGKTTTLRAVTGILPFDAGEITIDGMSVKERPVACKSVLAYIPDNPDLYEYLTGVQYLNYIGDIFGVEKALRRERIEKYAEMFRIKDDLGSLIGAYSHGMKQKLAVIAALLHAPRLMILDEPFVGLDPEAAFKLKQVFREMCEAGSAIFFSTHVLDVAEKVCIFLMLVSSAYMQSVSAFVAQNNGAGLTQRSSQALLCSIATALIAGIAMSLLALFGGALLSSVFSNEQAVITAAHSYLKAYAIDCLLTSVLFCFIGYFNGCKHTIFVMIQGVAGAFFVRIPVVYLMSRMDEATLFLIGLGTPVSSAVQIILCLAALLYFRKKEKNKEEPLA